MSLNIDLSPIVDKAIGDKLQELNLEEKINNKIEVALKGTVKTIELVLPNGSAKNIGLQHKQFESILKVIMSGEPLMIKGEAGNGKSHVVQQCAKALDLPFHSLSVSNQTTVSALMGFVDANGVYRSKGFVEAFTKGGIFCLDEIDAGNSNVLVVLNSALSNGFLELPTGEMAYAHDDFRFVATANTVGTGANAKYVGRNKLDGATLDRFTVIGFERDDDIELSLIGGDTLLKKAVDGVRKAVENDFEELIISQRSSVRLKKFLDMEFSIDEALEMALIKGADEDVGDTIKTTFKKHYKVPKNTSKKEESDEGTAEETSEVMVQETPKCPECGSEMVIRQARTGKHAGEKFWGCSNYPECKGIVAIEEESEKDPFDW